MRPHRRCAHIAAADVAAGGGFVAPRRLGLGLVIGDKDDDLGVVGGGVAHKGDDIVVLILGFHLGGARLAADAVARHIAVVAAALGNHLLQDIGGPLAGLFC